jgi:hypothetical protein
MITKYVDFEFWPSEFSPTHFVEYVHMVNGIVQSDSLSTFYKNKKADSDSPFWIRISNCTFPSNIKNCKTGKREAEKLARTLHIVNEYLILNSVFRIRIHLIQIRSRNTPKSWLFMLMLFRIPVQGWCAADCLPQGCSWNIPVSHRYAPL